jgi:hypothetical protein
VAKVPVDPGQSGRVEPDLRRRCLHVDSYLAAHFGFRRREASSRRAAAEVKLGQRPRQRLDDPAD